MNGGTMRLGPWPLAVLCLVARVAPGQQAPANERVRLDAHRHKLFDLKQEKQRLQDWVDHGGRELLLQDPRTIDRFLEDPRTGPLAGKDLAWFVHVIEPSGQAEKIWPGVFAQRDATPELQAATVMVNDPADCPGLKVPKHVLLQPLAQQRLVELVAVNMRELHFESRDLDPAGSGTAVGFNRLPCVRYSIRGERMGDYADWTSLHRGHHAAFLLDGRVLTAPSLERRIVGNSTFPCPDSMDEARAVAAAIKAAPLPVTPVFLKQEPADRR